MSKEKEDKELIAGLEKLKKDYISAIMTYLTTGKFAMSQGVTYMQAHTYEPRSNS